MTIEPGTMVTPKVRLTRQLGKGAMGSVWVAEHLSLKSQVAVKFVQCEKDANKVARFEREATAAAQLTSPHVVRTFDYGQMDDGTPYIVMELLHGATLSHWLRENGVLSLDQAVTVIRQVGRVLSEAHALGIIHRDIKPANLLIQRSDDELFVKVLDFGAAKHLRVDDFAGVTATGEIVGTLHYLSPEQFADSKDVGHQCDLWGLTVVLYHCLTGELPFHGNLLTELAIQVSQGNFTPPSTHRPELPQALDNWFGRALCPDLEERFSSPAEMVEAFVIALGPSIDPGLARLSRVSLPGAATRQQPSWEEEIENPPSSWANLEPVTSDSVPAGPHDPARVWKRLVIAVVFVALLAYLLLALLR